MSKKTRFFALAGLLGLSAVIVLMRAPGRGGDHPTVAPRTLTGDFGKIPVFFVPNRGQTDAQVSFYVNGADKTIYFAPDGVTFALDYLAGTDGRKELKRWAAKMDFLGARKDVKPEGLEETGADISYFKGKPTEWKTGLPAYSKIVYRDLWPGIDLAYKGEVDRLKYEFIVHPGADPSDIRLAYRGAERVALTKDGRLEVKTPAGAFEDDVPVAYQERNEGREIVTIAYSMDATSDGPERLAHAYGFKVGEYDRSRVLVLDPIVLVYCGYVGGTAGFEQRNGIAVDSLGNVYLTGQVGSDDLNFPAKVGPDLTSNGGVDAFVAKIDSSGTGLIYCGYIGGAGWDTGLRIAIDGSGSAYVTGYSEGDPTGFPVSVGPDLTFDGEGDAFVAKVSPSGTALVYCGFIGGNAWDAGYGIAVDGSGNAYVAGITYGGLPVKVGPDLTNNDIGGGWGDAFVAKVEASGASLVYCGYIGGDLNDFGLDIAVDSSGCAYITGFTNSNQGTFPLKNGPGLTLGGSGDAFVAKVDASGVTLVYCGYIGGSDVDRGTAIAVNDAGEAFVTGWTYSGDMGAVVGPYLFRGGAGDAFVAKVKALGTGFDYLGYIGGTGLDQGMGIAVNDDGNAYVTGITASSESGTVHFPVLDGPDLTYNGGDTDAFVAEVNRSGSALIYCGYIGGSAADAGYGIALDGAGYAYISGYTSSSEDTFPVVVGPKLIKNGDAFVAKVGDVPGPPITTLLPDSASAGDPGFLLTVVGDDFVNGAVVRWDGSNKPTTYVSSSELDATIAAADLASGKTVAVTVRNPNGGISNAMAFTISNPAPVLTSLSTTQMTGGSGAFALTVHGSSFVPNSVVRWNGSDRTTTFVSANELQGAITATDVTTGGEALVTVFNPTPAGGTSSSIAIQVSSFTVGATPTSVTLTAGQSAEYTIELAPQFGPFDAAVSFSYSGLPAKCTATFSPTTLTPGAASATTTLTLTTQASAGAAAGSLSGASGLIPPALGLLAIGLSLIFWALTRQRYAWRLRRSWIAAAAVICLVLLIGSCSSGGNNPPPYTGTPKGTHQISVQATSGDMTVPTVITLVVQ